MWQKTVGRSIQTRNPNRNQSPSHPIPNARMEKTRNFNLVDVVEEEEVEKLEAVEEETGFELLMVRKRMMSKMMTMKMRVTLKVMMMSIQSLKGKILVVRSLRSIR